MTLTRLAVGLEPSNALDAAASFAPIHSGGCRSRNWVPRWIRTRESIKQNKELAEYSGVSFRRSRSLVGRQCLLSFRRILARSPPLSRSRALARTPEGGQCLPPQRDQTACRREQ